MRQLKITFLLAKNPMDVDWYRPLAFGYLKSYLERFQCDAQMYSCDDTSEIATIKPDIVAVSATTASFKQAQVIGRFVKKYDNKIITVLGGHHVTYLPQTLSAEYDFGVIGEGEQTFLELITAIGKSGARISFDDFHSIAGLVFRNSGQLIQTAQRPLIEPLDMIPIPYRHPGDTPYLFSSRGCPYKCSFCASSSFWRKTRFFSAEYVVDEISFILSQFPKLEHLAICDDLFIADLPRLKKIVNLMEKKGLCGKVGLSSSVRANLVNDELCLLLKRINIIAIGIGIESGSDRILNILNKGVNTGINQKAIDILYKHGIDVRSSMIVGCPTECEKEVRSTYEFVLKNIKAKKISPQCAVNILSPMPGTKIWEDAVQSGIINLEDTDWDRLSIFASYKNSNIEDFDQWLQYRRNNNSVYLAEDTLPQERLYELMSYYEKAIKECEKE